MTDVRVHDVSISLDGYGAGPRQSADEPLGAGGESLREWIFAEDADERLLGNLDGALEEMAVRGVRAVARGHPRPPAPRVRSAGRVFDTMAP